MTESQDFLLNAKSLRITVYLSLALANLLFGALHPESIVVAGSGVVFFALLTLANLRHDDPNNNHPHKKLARINK